MNVNNYQEQTSLAQQKCDVNILEHPMQAPQVIDILTDNKSIKKEKNTQDKVSNIKFTATNYKISTITATCYINTEINLKNLFENINIISENDNDIGIVYLEYGANKYNSISKGTNSKKKTNQRKEKKIKRFDNQATARIKLMQNNSSYFVNMKLFKNGNIQMTGIRVIEDGIKCMEIIIDIITKYNEVINKEFNDKYINKSNTQIIDDIINSVSSNVYSIDNEYDDKIGIKKTKVKLLEKNYPPKTHSLSDQNNSTDRCASFAGLRSTKKPISKDIKNEIIDDELATINKIVEDTSLLQIIDYKVHLINCDFKVNFEIKRDDLKKLLIDTYKIKCFYEPCGYPGVKIEYFWNSDKDGICKCPENCSNLKKKSKCKKITIAVFQSGCIIITGGNTINQVDYAYEFICNVIKNNIPYIILNKKSIEDLKLLKSKKKASIVTDKDDVYYINKNNIINPFLLK